MGKIKGWKKIVDKTDKKKWVARNNPDRMVLMKKVSEYAPNNAGKWRVEKLASWNRGIGITTHWNKKTDALEDAYETMRQYARIDR